MFRALSFLWLISLLVIYMLTLHNFLFHIYIQAHRLFEFFSGLSLDYNEFLSNLGPAIFFHSLQCHVYKSVKRTLLDNTLGVLSQRLERPLIKAKIWNISINKSTVIEYIILKTSRQKHLFATMFSKIKRTCNLGTTIGLYQLIMHVWANIGC